VAAAAAPLPCDGFAARMAAFGPFPPAPRLAVGVSGGPDSLALILLADAWARARGGDALALIVDHGLRPESAAEAAAVAALLAARGIAAQVLRLRLQGGARLQERARAARLAALAEAAAARGRPWLLLGHQRRDQAETLAFRAARGSGDEGLAGIPPLRREGGVLLCRPLLGEPPEALEAVCAAAGVTPVRDPSNRDPRYARVRLRAALDPAQEEALAAAARAAAARRAALEAAVAGRLADAAAWHPAGAVRLDPAALGRDATARAALARLVVAVSGASAPPSPAAVARLLSAGQGSLGGAVWRGRWLLREASLCAPPVAALPGAVWDGRWRLDGAGDPVAEIGALGLSPAFRTRAPGVPAAALAALPAVRRAGALVAVPPLSWPDAGTAARFALRFDPCLPLERGFSGF
jgi:tRNA(Ile)-lysidine synthase